MCALPGTSSAQDAATAAVGAPTDRDFTVGDRVKAVQKKLILKEGRFELAPAFSASMNDAFFQKVGVGLATSYWASDSFGIFVDAYYLQTLETPNTRLAKQAFTSTLLESRLQFLAAGGFQWSPIYGKISWLTDDIIHFDLFISAGFGVAKTTTGVHMATTFGIGQRYLVNRFLAFFFKVEDRLYPETYRLKTNEQVTAISNVLTLSVGASFFFPMDFEYAKP